MGKNKNESEINQKLIAPQFDSLLKVKLLLDSTAFLRLVVIEKQNFLQNAAYHARFTLELYPKSQRYENAD